MGSCSSKKEFSNIKIEDFIPSCILGKGRYGTVYKAVHISTGLTVAIKEINKLYFEISEQNERKILVNLKSHFIVNLIFAFQSENFAYLCLDYMPGCSLRKYIESRPQVNGAELQFITACIIQALEYLKSKQIIHHDLKPDNLLFDSFGYLLLSDFGLSQTTKNLAKNSSGTLAYMAPEVLFGQQYSESSDVYSLGIILYEIIEGSRPYQVTSRKDLIENYVNIKFEIKNRSFGDEVLDFVKKCLIKNPINRIGANDFQEIKKHLWFKDFDWNLFKAKGLASPCTEYQLRDTESVSKFEESSVFQNTPREIPNFFYSRMNESEI